VLGVVPEQRPKDAKPYRFPKTCPCHLHTPVVRDETATGEAGAVSRCSGEFACPYQTIEHLKHFASRRAFDIDGLGEKQVEFFYEQGWVREPADIFTLARRNAAIRLEEQEGFGATSVGNLLRAIEARRDSRMRSRIGAVWVAICSRNPDYARAAVFSRTPFIRLTPSSIWSIALAYDKRR